MPNWCQNDVTVYGSQDEIMSFKALVASEDSLFDFNRIVPLPQQLEELGDIQIAVSGPVEGQLQYSYHRLVDGVRVPAPDAAAAFAKHGLQSTGDWYLTNWGTNKIAFDVELEDEDDRHILLKYGFRTAWTPAWGIYNALLKRYADHDLHITWLYDLYETQEAGFLLPDGRYCQWEYLGALDEGFYTPEELAEQQTHCGALFPPDDFDAMKYEREQEELRKATTQAFFANEARIKARFERVHRAQADKQGRDEEIAALCDTDSPASEEAKACLHEKKLQEFFGNAIEAVTPSARETSR